MNFQINHHLLFDNYKESPNKNKMYFSDSNKIVSIRPDHRFYCYVMYCYIGQGLCGIGAGVNLSI